MNRPESTLGLRHVALYVQDLAACEHFYVDLLGMQVEWRPDPDNLYLTTAGQDNLALHRRSDGAAPGGAQVLDHIGFILPSPEQVDVWHAFLAAHGVTIKAADVFIGTYCIENRTPLLTSDQAFVAMRDHLGLRLVDS